MYTIEGEDKKPVLWPGGSLAHLGQNPYGENIWRVVWSESRTFMCKGDADSRFNWYPLYRGKKCYILERWLSAWQFCKMGPEMWALKEEQYQGPYPSRGVYYGPCWEFEGYPTLGAIESIVNLIQAGDQYSDEERRQAVLQAQEKEDVLAKAKATEIILDSLPLSVTTGKLSQRFYSDAENIPERLSAQDISKLKGLPVGQGKVFTSGAKRI